MFCTPPVVGVGNVFSFFQMLIVMFHGSPSSIHSPATIAKWKDNHLFNQTISLSVVKEALVLIERCCWRRSRCQGALCKPIAKDWGGANFLSEVTPYQILKHGSMKEEIWIKQFRKLAHIFQTSELVYIFFLCSRINRRKWFNNIMFLSKYWEGNYL